MTAAYSRKGNNVAGCARSEGTQRGNNGTIKSLTDEHGRLVKGQDKMCVSVYKHFANLLGKRGALDHGKSLKDFLAGGPRLSAREAECCEGTITAEVT